MVSKPISKSGQTAVVAALSHGEAKVSTEIGADGPCMDDKRRDQSIVLDTIALDGELPDAMNRC